ncbi:hypothetical protein RND71_005114 [Anisodus tanguticus]|uniref:Uncharacterized protein n=1 Tax=Anisodus tanguticus TaxID=243964 RepID=A0AAE1VMC1_9SOLA|nr:hypothetical protein RND71_005114 [Anisodus tanguticus]
MKVERNKLKRIVDGLEGSERDNMRNIVDEMEVIIVEMNSLKKKLEETDIVNVQEAAKIYILEEKVEEMEFITAQEAGKVVNLEKKIKKLKTNHFSFMCFVPCVTCWDDEVNEVENNQIDVHVLHFLF